MRKIYSLLTTGILYVCGFSQTVVLPSGISETENYVFTRTYLDASSTSSRDVKQIQSVTYFDGLGRPKQRLDIQASHGQADLVTKIEYDGLGRQDKEFLPMPQQGTTHGSIYGSISEAVGAPLYGGPPPYFAKKETEYSPLERPLSTTAPGAWGTNNKKVEMNYAFNTAADKVKMYSTDPASWADGTTAAALKIIGEYPANRLYKSTVTDEDGNTSVEFKNKQGQTVHVRKVLSPTQNADTYYVYNEYQDLAYVLPPLFSDKNKNATTALLTSGDDLQELCYQYRYDKKNRLVEKKLPGKGLEYMVYDNQDRLVMAQDANLKINNRWLFTKYDTFGRIAYTGTTTDSRSREEIQGTLNSLAGNNVARTSGGAAYGQGVTLQYDNDATKNYPNTITELLSINYYDTYPNSSPALPASIQGQEVLQQEAPAAARSTKGLPTAAFVKNIGQSAWTRSFLRYDMKGRLIATHAINHLGGYTKTESLLEFSGVPKKTLTYHSRIDAPTPTVTILEEFFYDHQNRMTKHEHTVNNNPPETLATNTYNEIGRLAKKEVGNNIQEVDYSYNVRGWMTGINLDGNGNFQPGKLFNYKVNYNDPTKAPGYPEPDAALQVRSRWNGNIAEVFWRNDGDTDGKKYGYAYDGLNRLVAGVYRNPLNPASREHSEWPTYDLNGNILTLRRTSYFVGTAASLIDDLQYTYAGNRATRIVDDSQDGNGYEGGGGTITYDANGNMDSMPDKWINSITYNILNLPSQIDIGSGKRKADVGYLYNSAGVKLKKTSNSLGRGMSGNLVIVTNITEYLDGFQYLSTHTSETLKREESDSELELAMEREAFMLEEAQELVVAPPGGGTAVPSVLQFVPTAEGFYSFTENRYIYQYKDHLGNARVTYAKNQGGGIDVLDKNDYYPFGMNHLSTDGGAFFGQGSYKNYKYNGKELQETGMYDYGARFYMPDIGRWGVVDPLAEKMRRWSPYNYAVNNPINFIDPDGRGVESTHTDKFGNVVMVANDGDNGVYKHSGDTQETLIELGKSYNSESNTSAGGERMGETEFWDEFVDPDTNMESGTIHFGNEQSWDPLIADANEYSKKVGLEKTMEESKLHQGLDIKNNKDWSSEGPMTGRLLNGKYATGRSAGNYLAGLNGVTSTLRGFKISGSTYMKMAGAYQKGLISTPYKILNYNLIGSILFFGNSYGPEPYYGEEPYSGRRILEGIKAGEKENNK